MLIGTSVELPDMLMAREARAAAQQDCQKAHPGCTLLSFGLNIPGPVKTNDDLRRLFADGLHAIEERLHEGGWTILEQREHHAPTGDECLIAIEGKPARPPLRHRRARRRGPQALAPDAAPLPALR